MIQAPLFPRESIETADPVSIILRPYQARAMEAVAAAFDRGLERVLCVMATGTGKTTLFSEVLRQYVAEDPGRYQGLVIAHRDELLTQAAGRIAAQNPSLIVGIEAGDTKAAVDSDVVVAGVQSIGRPGSNRLRWMIEAGIPIMCIVDEAHHSPADSYMNAFRRFGAYTGKTLMLGVTATPHRLDNKPLHGQERSIYEEVAYSFSIQEAIKDGWLVDVKGYRIATGIDLSSVKTTGGDYNQKALDKKVNTAARNELAFASWKSAAADRQTVVFCVSVDHATEMAEVFRAGGVRAEVVTGMTDDDTRAGIFRRLRTGETQVVTNVDICTEGWDDPTISCVLMMRPTKSWALYAQCIGRGLRVLPGVVDGVTDADARRAAVQRSDKSQCIVIDVVDTSTDMDLGDVPEQGKAALADPTKAPPSLGGLVGLPLNLDIEGETLGRALEIFEGLPEAMRNRADGRQISLSGLSAELTEVDIIRELKSAPEADLSGLSWHKRSPFLYVLQCGHGHQENEREAELSMDQLDVWRLHLRSSRGHSDAGALGKDLRSAFHEADKIVGSWWPGARKFAEKKAPWRTKPITPEGRRKLAAAGIPGSLIDKLTMGDAYNLYRRTMLGGPAEIVA